jgi:hypothetical protein
MTCRSARSRDHGRFHLVVAVLARKTVVAADYKAFAQWRRHHTTLRGSPKKQKAGAAPPEVLRSFPGLLVGTDPQGIDHVFATIDSVVVQTHPASVRIIGMLWWPMNATAYGRPLDALSLRSTPHFAWLNGYP